MKAAHLLRVLPIALLLTHAGLLWGGLRVQFVTVDEVRHVEAGLSYWETGTFGASHVNPPLSKALAVLPVLMVLPDTNSRELRHNPQLVEVIALARLMGIAWSLLGGWLIYRWAGELYGSWAGCLGMALWCLGPNVLAHAQLMTPDVPAAVAGLAATYAFWRYLRQPSWDLACVAGLLLGIAQLTKFTLLLLYAVWPLLWLIHRLQCRSDAVGSLRQVTRHALLIGLISLAVVNVGYGFEGTGHRLGNYSFASRLLAVDASEGASVADQQADGNRFRDSWLGSLPVPLPEDFVLGIDDQRARIEHGPASYLAGEWSRQGWWYYYLYALAVKVPLGVWGLVLWGGVWTVLRRKSSACFADEMTLWLPAVLLLAFVSSQTGINRHLRYVLPIFPFVVVSTSKVACFFRDGPWKARLLAAVLLVWVWGSSLAVYPHSLAYFNELAGGPENGHAHLIDSNIDWGQDLLFLRAWLEKHPEARPLGLAYFNLIDPCVVGMEYRLPPRGPSQAPGATADPEQTGPQPGYFAVSVNFLRGKEFSAPNGQGGRQAVARHDYQYFRRFTPIAKAGYSIYIYHITIDEANEVRRQLALPELPQAQSSAGEVIP